MTGNQERQFRFGAIVHEDYRQWALLLPQLEDRLNQQINLEDYTDQVRRIYFAPILMPAYMQEETEERRFDAGKKQLWLKVKLSVEDLTGSDEILFADLVGQALTNDLSGFSLLPPEMMEKVRQVFGAAGR